MGEDLRAVGEPGSERRGPVVGAHPLLSPGKVDLGLCIDLGHSLSWQGGRGKGSAFVGARKSGVPELDRSACRVGWNCDASLGFTILKRSIILLGLL